MQIFSFQRLLSDGRLGNSTSKFSCWVRILRSVLLPRLEPLSCRRLQADSRNWIRAACFAEAEADLNPGFPYGAINQPLLARFGVVNNKDWAKCGWTKSTKHQLEWINPWDEPDEPPMFHWCRRGFCPSILMPVQGSVARSRPRPQMWSRYTCAVVTPFRQSRQQLGAMAW